MNDMHSLTNLIIIGILFLLTLFNGIWLDKTGRPYNRLIFNFHKFSALGTIIAAGYLIYHLFKPLEENAMTLSLIIASTVTVLVIFISGAVMSESKTEKSGLVLIHNGATILSVLLITMLLYLLNNRG